MNGGEDCPASRFFGTGRGRAPGANHGLPTNGGEECPASRFFGTGRGGCAPGAVVYIKGSTGRTGAPGKDGEPGKDADPAETLAALAERVAALDLGDIRNFAALKGAFLDLIDLLRGTP